MLWLLLHTHRYTHDCEVLLCVKSGPLTRVCAHVCSLCVYLLLCVCCMSAHGKGCHNPRTKCLSSGCGLRVCVYVSLVSPESPSLSSFPTSLSSPFQASSGTKSSPKEPESHLCSGWGAKGELITSSVSSPWWRQTWNQGQKPGASSCPWPKNCPSDTSTLGRAS